MRVVTFGEVMLRMAPENFLRLRQAIPGRLEATFGGGELNVAVSIALQGGHSAFLSVLPDNVLSDAFEQELRKLGVDASLIQRADEGRFGIYFVETGANQRASTVTYDRAGSSVALQSADTYDWPSAFQGAGWFHVTGITPALSREAARATLASVQAARKEGLTVSCDLNFRKKLWRWKPGVSPVDLARETMRGIMPFVDVVIANEEDADFALGIRAPQSDVESGELNIGGYQHVARQVVQEFSHPSIVAVTLRESRSASHNNWGGLLYDAKSDRCYPAPLDAEGSYRPYEIRNIVDRVGAGDAFAGALIFALTTDGLSTPDTAIRYAVAAGCLKHSIPGDFNYSARAEIEALVAGSQSGRVDR